MLNFNEPKNIQSLHLMNTISRFVPSVIFLLLGIGALSWGISNDQSGPFIIAGVGILIVGAIVLLNTLEIISNKISMGVSIVLVVASGLLTYLNYESIDEPMRFIKEKNRRYVHVVQRLKDIREIETAFKKEKGTYTSNFDTLLSFVQYDSITVVKSNGTVPDTLTEAEALEQGILTRDTTKVPAFESIFNSEYMETRLKDNELSMSSISDLAYVPFSNPKTKFKLESGSITKNNVEIQVFQCTDAAPFDKNDVMQVGSMTAPSTSGNWKEER